MLKSFKMLRASVLLLVICLNAGLSYGMDCKIGHTTGLKNFIDTVTNTNSCPGVFDPAEKSFCCYSLDRTYYCCDAAEFGITASWVILTAVLSVVIVVSLIVFCISCLCCSCCPWYRRRHRGTVYGRVQAPASVVHVIQTPANVPPPQPQPAPYYANVLNPTNSTGLSQPPPYTAHENDIYSKQAPYNPNYV
ncbi:uncharacterized protein LOC143185154 [Calliopsis andreniformis]|uniref:uncharacterized protein LOC143185154 n=1 Tax=Calliopsis andreniformis TaxID=337506 RepID=UPI003FCEC0E7